jgi:DNA polymerase III delta prime subunit
MAFRIPGVRELTDEQRAIFDLPTDGRFLITGPPGTGKTVLALLRAKRLVEQGRRPTILLYGKALSAMVAAEAEKLGIADRMRTYHSWVNWMHRQAVGFAAPTIEPYVYDWQAISRHASEIVASHDRLDLRDVIIDEGQDLPRDFYALLAGVSSSVTVFADENQRLTDVHSTIQEIRSALAGPREMTITKNFRNTRPVAELSARFYTGTADGIPSLPDRPGPVSKLVRCDDEDHFARVVARVVLVSRQRDDFGVLVWKKAARDRIAAAIREALPSVSEELATKQPAKAVSYRERGGRYARRVHTYDNSRADLPPLGEDGVFVICHASAKGLEFDAVFVGVEGLDGSDDVTHRMRTYVLATRPRNELYFVWRGQREEADQRVVEWIREAPSDLLDRVKGV